jgi:hypothetical protein
MPEISFEPLGSAISFDDPAMLCRPTSDLTRGKKGMFATFSRTFMEK